MKIPAIIFPGILIITTAYCCGGRERHLSSGIHDEGALITKAERFTLQKNDSCTIITIIGPWQGAEGIKQVYYLVKKGRNTSIADDKGSVIYVPIERIICMSSTHLAMIAALGEEDAIVGVSGAGFIYNKTLSEKVKRGLISDIGYEAGMNSELILKRAPELVMMYGIGSESAGYVGKIKELGVRVMFNADYLETDPLGKAEWIKLFGALFCKEELADSLFRSIGESYAQTKEIITENTKTIPTVLLGLPFRDTWFISPGNSYISQLINDAGGRYLWQETESSFSMPYSLENVYLKSLKADYWINIGSADSKTEIASYDSRFEAIPCFRNGNLYNNNNRVTSAGGNDYWESGTLNPHIILKDIASILHPGLFKDYDLFYYRKIE